jgi:glycosyltransferase involved in cell wall biosynthesis
VKASVWMITYNHEKYIAQAIESVMNQVTSFDFELVIGEDYSSDRTREICLAYERRYPGKINVLKHQTNVGVHRNVVETLAACKGEYVALLEGDDYWTDMHKLQKQVDFLSQNSEFAMCYQKTLEINELTGFEKVTNEKDNPVTGLEEILERGWFMRTGSLVFRNGLIKKFPDWFYQYSSTDYMLHILIARRGKIAFLNETTSVYRRHEGGITQAFQRKIIAFNEKKQKLLDVINEFLEYKYDVFIKRHKQDLYTASFSAALRGGTVSDLFYLIRILPKINLRKILTRTFQFVKRRIVKK